jgi:CHASE2 domain-containing sensor protein
MDTPISSARQTSLLIGALFLMLAFFELTWLHALSPLENRLSDWFVRQQAQSLKPDADIGIVDIDFAPRFFKALGAGKK